MANQSNGSQSPQRPHADRNFEFKCPGCGSKFISKSSGCPTCGSSSNNRGEELTKKVMDDDLDLIK